jgi:hypothetical protein
MQILKSKWSKLTQEHRVLGLIIPLGLFLGLIYVFLLPPWQHYDEPGQFEYAWLIANRDGLPKAGEYDQSLRREVASSMLEHNFFRHTDYRPNLISITEPIWIGVSQVGSSPLYYLLASIPLRFIQSTDVRFQLYFGRLISLLLFIVTVGASYGISVELTPPKHPLRWLLPISILLVPSFVDMSTALNDDVGATAFFSLFLWTGIRLMLRGFRWLTFLGFVLLTIFCFFTKSTVMHAALLGTIPILFSIFRGANRRFIWIAFAAGLILSGVVLFNWGYPRNWISESSMANSIRTFDKKAPVGEHIFQFRIAPGEPVAAITQLIPDGNRDPNKYKVITMGAWIWADTPTTVQTPILNLDNRKIFKNVEVTEEPRFFTISKTIQARERLVNIAIVPTISQNDEAGTVYYDGIVLVDGDWSGKSSPIFSDTNGISGVWGQHEFTNLVRNASAEKSGINFRSWVDTYIGSRIPVKPSQILGIIMDPEPVVSYYAASAKFLFQTFWARFAKGQVLLIGNRPYTIIGIFTFVGFLAAILAFWRNRRDIRWDILLFLGLALVSVWGAAIVRGLPSLINGGSFMGPARYVYPVIIPTMLILDIGWLELIKQIEQKSRIPQRYQLVALILIFVLLNVLSVYSIYVYYSS